MSRLEKERKRRTGLETSLSAFFQEAWPHFDPAPYTHGWHIDAIAKHLQAVTEGRIRRLLINVPPRHTKTLLVSVGGNPAFDIFIQNLLMEVRVQRGRWSNYRLDGIWKGTLLKALEILKKYLPQQGFFPPGEIGRSVEHIRMKLNDHLRKAS